MNSVLSLHHSKSNLSLSILPTPLPGFPEDGHKEERGAAEAPKREIRHQHRPSKVTLWKPSAAHLEFFAHVQTSHTACVVLIMITVVENIFDGEIRHFVTCFAFSCLFPKICRQFYFYYTTFLVGISVKVIDIGVRIQQESF